MFTIIFLQANEATRFPSQRHPLELFIRVQVHAAVTSAHVSDACFWTMRVRGVTAVRGICAALSLVLNALRAALQQSGLKSNRRFNLQSFP